ncbi:hypothetical protein KPATCC21470_7640 [Kitasatospora purpeofusca]
MSSSAESASVNRRIEMSSPGPTDWPWTLRRITTNSFAPTKPEGLREHPPVRPRRRGGADRARLS